MFIGPAHAGRNNQLAPEHVAAYATRLLESFSGRIFCRKPVSTRIKSGAGIFRKMLYVAASKVAQARAIARSGESMPGNVAQPPF